MNESLLIEQILARIEAEAEAGRFSGAALVANTQGPLLLTAHGYAIHPNLVVRQT